MGSHEFYFHKKIFQTDNEKCQQSEMLLYLSVFNHKGIKHGMMDLSNIFIFKIKFCLMIKIRNFN